MENLNAENFWNELDEKYPLGTEIFYKWFWEYQEKNDWSYMFRAKRGKAFQTPGYKEIPMAMQMGIWIEFVTEQAHNTYYIDLSKNDWRAQITSYINLLDELENITLENKQ